MPSEPKPFAILSSILILGAMIGILLADQLLSNSFKDMVLGICLLTLMLSLLLNRVTSKQLDNMRLAKTHYLQIFRRYLNLNNRAQ